MTRARYGGLALVSLALACSFSGAGVSEGGASEASGASGESEMSVATSGGGETESETDATDSGVGSSSSDWATTGSTTDAETSSGGTGEPPFTCDPLPANGELLDAIVLFDPAAPHPGDTLTVIVRATNGLGKSEAPPLQLEVKDHDGVRLVDPQTVEGGEVLYYFALPDVALGDICLRGLVNGVTEASASITVTPRPPSPPREQGGVFKVVENHMWTCEEQPDWGNELHVFVRDEQGQPLAGRVVEVRLADSTDPGSIYNAGEQPVPTELVTDDNGHAALFNYWPISDNGLLVLKLAVAGVASDIATEITTGWWEDFNGCRFCDQPLRNVWGHWSHTVTFQRTQGVDGACRVPTDHAGMNPGKCGAPRHIHHAPGATDCWVIP